MFAVVEHEQNFAITDAVRAANVRRSCHLAVSTVLVSTDGGRDGFGDGDRIDHGRELHEPGFVVISQVCEVLEDEPGLADPTWTEDRDEACAGLQTFELRELCGPSDERRQRCGELWPSGHPERCRRRERAVVGEHRMFECPQLRTGLDADLLDERRAGTAEGPQRVGLTSAAVEGDHQLGVEAFPEGVRLDES